MNIKENRDKVYNAFLFTLSKIESEESLKEFKKCFASKGKNKGWLKANVKSSESYCPIFQALMFHANIYKHSISSVIMMDKEESALFKKWETIIGKCAKWAPHLDKDRASLESYRAY